MPSFEILAKSLAIDILLDFLEFFVVVGSPGAKESLWSSSSRSSHLGFEHQSIFLFPSSAFTARLVGKSNILWQRVKEC